MSINPRITAPISFPSYVYARQYADKLGIDRKRIVRDGLQWRICKALLTE